MDDNIAFFVVRDSRNRLHKTLAFTCTVSGILVKMTAPEAIGAMVP